MSIIPSDRLIDWTLVGISGGIPSRTTMFANVTNAPYNAVGNDSTDNLAAIQAALDACPSGQYVYIPTGIFRISGSLNVPSNITVRGDGFGLTIIKLMGSGTAGFNFGADNVNYFPAATTTTITGNTATKNATTITVTSASGISIGKFLIISETNAAYVYLYGAANGPPGATWVDGWDTLGTRARGQIVEVTGVSGTTITFTPPLYSDYTNTPWATRFTAACENSGVEDLEIYATNSGTTRNIYFNCASKCWAKNVKGNFTDGDHCILDWSFRCEVRHCYFLDGFAHTAGTTEDCLGLRYKSSSCLIIDNIINRAHISILTEWGAAGNVIAYNFMTGEYSDSESGGSRAVQEAFCLSHGAHPQFNLCEGNITTICIADSYWGSSSNTTLLRNCFLGHATSHSPYSTRVGATGATYELVQARRALDVWEGQSGYNAIGNILGDSQETAGVFKIIDPASRTYEPTRYLWSLGYASTSDGGGISILPNPTGSYIDHGNYDYVNQSVTWNPAISDHDVPNSLFLSSKPSWFGILTWPPFNALSPNPTGTAIPAGYRYFYGIDPPTTVLKRLGRHLKFKGYATANSDSGGGGGGGGGSTAPTRSQSNGKDSSASTTHTITLPSVTAGHCLALGFRVGAATIVSITDTSSNTWNDSGLGVITDGAGNNLYVYVAANVAASAGTLTVTVTVNTSATCRLAIIDIAGASTSAPVDKFISGVGANTSPTSGNTATTTNADELLVGWIESDDAHTFTAGSGYTPDANGEVPAAPNSKLLMEYQTVSVAAAYAATATMTSVGGNIWAAAIVTFTA